MISFSRIKFCFIFLIGYYIGFLVFAAFRHVCISELHSSFLSKASNKLSEFESAFDEKIADDLFSTVKIACLVMTNPSSHKTKAIQLKNTWGKRCNKLMFVTTESDPELDTIVLSVNDSKTTIRKKIKKGFLHFHEHFVDDFDWFIKADDDR